MKNKRENLADGLAVLGAVTMSIGVGMIFLPAGIIVAGIAAVILGWAVSRGGDSTDI